MERSSPDQALPEAPVAFGFLPVQQPGTEHDEGGLRARKCFFRIRGSFVRSFRASPLFCGALLCFSAPGDQPSAGRLLPVHRGVVGPDSAPKASLKGRSSEVRFPIAGLMNSTKELRKTWIGCDVMPLILQRHAPFEARKERKDQHRSLFPLSGLPGRRANRCCSLRAAGSRPFPSTSPHGTCGPSQSPDACHCDSQCDTGRLTVASRSPKSPP